MTNLFDIYKDIINNLDIPPFSMDNYESRHRLFSKKKRSRIFVSLLFAILISSICFAGTVYAAHVIQKNIIFTKYGEKTDSSLYQNEVSDGLVHSYDSNLQPLEKTISKEEDIGPLEFNTWGSVEQLVSFPLIYPLVEENVNWQIFYQNNDSIENIEAVYVSSDKELGLKIIYFGSKGNWDLSTDYNGNVGKQWVYENDFKSLFSISEVQYEDCFTYYATIAFPCYYIQYSFTGYSEQEIYSILDALNLSVYE